MRTSSPKVRSVRDNGKENGNYYSIIGYIGIYIYMLCRDNGKENGN